MLWSAVLLAGGKSSRMGRDKAFLEIDGQPLWRRQADLLARIAPEQLMISGPRRPEWGALAVVPDEQAHAGPLAGVAATLRKCQTPHLVVLAVDLPRMTSDYLRSLLQLCTAESGVVPSRDGRFEPLAAVYPTACLSLIDAALRRNDYSMQNLVRRARDENLITEQLVSASEVPLFANLNSPADL